MPVNNSPRFVVTLVHGTFASKADWIQPDSPLAQQLADRFGDALLLAPPFVWSGSNSHQARLVAGRDLREHLQPQLTRYPHAQHSLVCHSHGGNVALYALRDGKLRRKIHSVICLATPFIDCRRRDFRIGLQTLAWVIGGIVAVVAFVLIFAFPIWLDTVFGFDLFGGLLTAPLALAWVFTLFLGPLAGAAAVSHLLLKYLSPRANKAQQAMLDRLVLPPISSTRVFSLQYSSDEARGFLSLLQWTANLPHLTLAALVIPYRWLMEAGNWLLEKGPQAALGPTYLLLLLILLLPTLVFMPLWLLIVMLHFLLRRHEGGFGEPLAEGLLVKVLATQEPPTQIQAIQSQFQVDHIIGGGGILKYLRFWLSLRLLHSCVYTDSKAIDWIAGVLRDKE